MQQRRSMRGAVCVRACMTHHMCPSVQCIQCDPMLWGKLPALHPAMVDVGHSIPCMLAVKTRGCNTHMWFYGFLSVEQVGICSSS